MANAREGFGSRGAKATYDRLASDRTPYETRAESCAAVTIPSLFPKASDNASTDYATPWQAVGARGLNNLASKLMLALFPLTPWMKLSVSEFGVEETTGDPEAKTLIDQGLAKVERTMMNYMDANNYRPSLFELLKQIVAAGNALLYMPPPTDSGGRNPPKVYRMNSYVVQRDNYGNVLQIVTRDMIAYGALPEETRSAMDSTGEREPDEEVEVYTHVYRDMKTEAFLSYQEVDGVEIAGSDGSYPLTACPWIPVRFIKRDGEHYGRSHVEEYLGDLESLENLMEAMVKFAMISAKVIGLVNPTGSTQVRRLAKAKTGDYVAGRKADIEYLQLEKSADFNTASNVAEAIEGRLSYAFLLNSAVQRSGERVTAEEIRYVASELEDTLGGVYSILSQELQLPIVRVLLHQLQATEKIPELPEEAIEPTVATGLEALGRGQDLTKLQAFVQSVQAVSTLQDPDINATNLKLRFANAIGIDTAGLLLTTAEKQKMQAEEVALQGTSAMAQAAGAGVGQQATATPEAMQAAAAQAGMI